MNRVAVSILALSVVAHVGCRTRIGECSEDLSSPPLLTPLPDHAGARDCRTGSPSASADPSGADKVLITQMPVVIAEAKGAYPCEAYRSGKEGKVVMRVTVDEHGDVADIVVVRSAGSVSLDEAAVHATRYRKFLPACTNLDRPVAVRIIYTYAFSFAER